MITPRTKAILGVNLIGNAPDWDRIRAIADAHGLQVIEDSCDALGATLHGTPTGTRADISLTSFALSHIITAAGTGGMVLLDDPELIDQCVLLRRWGRRSEVQLYGTKKGDKRFFSDVDGLEYDNLFIFDEVGWNFEPSEISAAFGVEQLRKLPTFLARRQRNFTLLSELFAQHADVFVLPRQLEGLETGWHMFPFLIRPESGIRRAELQHHMESHGIDTRMVWTGNVLRQPAFTQDRAPRRAGRVPQRRPCDGAGPRAARRTTVSPTTTSPTSARPSTRSSRRPAWPDRHASSVTGASVARVPSRRALLEERREPFRRFSLARCAREADRATR